MKLLKSLFFSLWVCLLFSGSICFAQSQDNDQEIVFIAINHASFVIESAAANIFVDPVGAVELYSGLKPADIILITHSHYDHLDQKVIEAVMQDGTLIVGPEDVIAQLGSGTVLNNGQSKQLKDITIKAVPMYNLSEDRLKFHPKGNGNGYIVSLQGKRIYIAGDTEDIQEMRQLKDIDYAFICMNLPYTMTVEQAASAVLDFKPKVVFPYHYRGPDGISDLAKFKELVGSDPLIQVKFLDWYEDN